MHSKDSNIKDNFLTWINSHSATKKLSVIKKNYNITTKSAKEILDSESWLFDEIIKSDSFKIDNIFEKSILKTLNHQNKYVAVVEVAVEDSEFSTTKEFLEFVNEVAVQVISSKSKYVYPEDDPKHLELVSTLTETYEELYKDRDSMTLEHYISNEFFYNYYLMNTIYYKTQKSTFGKYFNDFIKQHNQYVNIQHIYYFEPTIKFNNFNV